MKCHHKNTTPIRELDKHRVIARCNNCPASVVDFKSVAAYLDWLREKTARLAERP